MKNTNTAVIDQNKIIECMEQSGIISYSNQDDSPLDMDSITFISIIVGLENEFEVEISDRFLIYELGTYQEFLKFATSAVADALETKECERSMIDL